MADDNDYHHVFKRFMVSENFEAAI